MDNPEGRYHRASWLPVIAADILPIVRLDIRNERIHILDILHVDDSPDLLELFGSHQHVTCSRYGINDIHGRPAMFLDGLPEIVGKFGRHGIPREVDGWMIPVYLNRLMKARNSGRESSIGSRPEDDGPLGQLVDSLSPWKSEKRRRFPPENRSDTDFLSTRRTLSWALADKPSSSMAALRMHCASGLSVQNLRTWRGVIRPLTVGPWIWARDGKCPFDRECGFRNGLGRQRPFVPGRTGMGYDEEITCSMSQPTPSRGTNGPRFGSAVDHARAGQR